MEAGGISSGRTAYSDMSLLNDSEPGPPAGGRSRAASIGLPSAARTAPPPRASGPAVPRSPATSPYCAAYRNEFLREPPPDECGAALAEGITARSIRGLPVTATGSEKSTVTSIVLPWPYLPSSSGEETLSATTSLSIKSTWTAPVLVRVFCAPTTRSVTPSPSMSAPPATELPNRSEPPRLGPACVEPSSTNVCFTVPPEFKSMTYSVLPVLRPAAMSGTPSPSRSPIPADEMPSCASFASERPPAVDPFISAVLFTVPSELRNMTCRAPTDVPEAASSPGAPAARSGTPSPSRSPTAASDEPNASSFASEGPFGVDELISAALFTVPSRFISSRWTAPRPLPPASSPGAPAAMSGTPSPSRSPMPAAEAPNRSPITSDGPLADSSISTACFTVPSRLRNMTCSAPIHLPLTVESPGAPAATSGIPSLSRSPMPATDAPNSSPEKSVGPLAVRLVIEATCFAVPSRLRNTTCAVPMPNPVRRSGAPAATSGIPSASRSPTNAAPAPKRLRAGSDRPREEPPISAVPSTPPLARGTMPPIPHTYAAPSPACPLPEAPAARSGMPSPSRSPTAASEEPSMSPSCTPPGSSLILELAVGVPSDHMKTACTAPPPPGAPAAMSGIPSRSRSPAAASDEPNASPSARSGP